MAISPNTRNGSPWSLPVRSWISGESAALRRYHFDMPKPTSTRERQQRWRERLPEIQHLVEVVSPDLMGRANDRRQKALPPEWTQLVEMLHQKVVREADKEEADEVLSRDERRGWHWSLALLGIEDMLEHLTSQVLADIGVPADQTIASTKLLTMAVGALRTELAEPMHKRGGLVARHRRQAALEALSPHFDDLQVRRVAALEAAESFASLTHIMSDDEVEQASIAALDAGFIAPENAEKHRRFLADDRSAIDAVLAKDELSRIDAAFGDVDPLVFLEEFSIANAGAKGGRSLDGEGQTGAARALARLAVMAEALGFNQTGDEGFDEAVERARRTLLMSRSRMKKRLDEFPTVEDAPEATIP